MEIHKENIDPQIEIKQKEDDPKTLSVQSQLQNLQVNEKPKNHRNPRKDLQFKGHNMYNSETRSSYSSINSGQKQKNLRKKSSSQEEDEDEKSNNQSRIQQSKQIQDEYLKDKLKVLQSTILPQFDDYIFDKYNYFIIKVVLDEDDIQGILLIFQKLQNKLIEYSIKNYSYKIIQLAMEKAQEILDKYKDDLAIKPMQQNNGTQQVIAKNSTQLETVRKIQDFYEKMSQVILENTKNKKLPIHQYGNYIVSKGIQLFQGEKELQIIQIIKNMLETEKLNTNISSDQYGCLMIQTLIEKHKQYQNDPESEISQNLDSIIKFLITNVIHLSKQQFSNYVIQQMMQKGEDKYKIQIQEIIISQHFEELSKDKYGSNVVEIVIKTANDNQLFQIFKLLLNEKTNLLLTLVNDQYANYVIKKFFFQGTTQIQKALQTQIIDYKKINSLNEYGTLVYNQMFKQNDSYRGYKQQQQPYYQEQYQQMQMQYMCQMVEQFYQQCYQYQYYNQSPVQQQDQLTQQQQIQDQQQQPYYSRRYSNNNSNNTHSDNMTNGKGNGNYKRNNHKNQSQKNHQNRKKKY